MASRGIRVAGAVAGALVPKTGDLPQRGSSWKSLRYAQVFLLLGVRRRGGFGKSPGRASPDLGVRVGCALKPAHITFFESLLGVFEPTRQGSWLCRDPVFSKTKRCGQKCTIWQSNFRRLPHGASCYLHIPRSRVFLVRKGVFCKRISPRAIATVRIFVHDVRPSSCRLLPRAHLLHPRRGSLGCLFLDC